MVSLLTCLVLANVCEVLQSTFKEDGVQIWIGEVMIMREELKLSQAILNLSFWLLLWGFHCSDVWRARGSCRGSLGAVFVAVNHGFHTGAFVGYVEG